MALASQLFLQPDPVQYYTYSAAYLKFSSVLISPARWRWPVSCSSSQVEVSQSAACGSSSPPCTVHLDVHCKVTVYCSICTHNVFTVYLIKCDEKFTVSLPGCRCRSSSSCSRWPPSPCPVHPSVTEQGQQSSYTATKIPFMCSQKRNCAASLSPNVHIHVSVSDVYIRRIGPQSNIFLQQNRQTNRGNI